VVSVIDSDHLVFITWVDASDQKFSQQSSFEFENLNIGI